MKSGGSHSDETKAKMSRQRKGRQLPANWRSAISKGLTGKPKTDEHRAAISKAQKGSRKEPWSEERKAARRAQIAARKGADA